MLLSEGIRLYKADRVAKGVAASTIRGEQGVLREFLAAAGDIQMHNIQPKHIDMLYARKTDIWSASTSNKARAMLASFFTWGRRRSYIPRQSDPLEGLRKRRVNDKERIIVPPEEFSTLLDAADNPRDRAMVAIGLYLFLRVSETQMLRWRDVSFDESHKDTDRWRPTVSIYRTKTGTTDTLPLSIELYRELRRWKLAYAADVGQAVQPGWYVIPARTMGVFAGVKGEVRSLRAVEPPKLIPSRQCSDLTRVISRVLQAAGRWDVGEGGHTLRRSGAVALYQQLSSVGHDRAIRTVQAMLGHAGIQTTEVYLKLSLDRKSRNDLLAGKMMFPRLIEGTVKSFKEDAQNGQENTGSL